MYIDFDSLGVVPGDNGENKVWDFSAVVKMDTSTWAYLKPIETPYYKYFPKANIAMTRDKAGYDYFLFTDSGYFYLGDFTPKIKVVEITTYQKNDYCMQYPVEYGSSFQAEKKFIYRSGRDVHYVTNNLSYTADAWGTLILPYGRISNTLRIHEVNIYRDSSIHNGETFYSEDEHDTYRWFAPGIMAPLVVLTTATSSDEPGKISFDYSLAVVLSENYLSNKTLFPLNLKVMENTSEKFSINISFEISRNEKVKLTIHSLSGQKVYSKSESMPAGKNYFTYNYGKLAKGVYIITVAGKDTEESIKWVQIHD